MTQHVFFRAWQQSHTYEPGRGSLATWLLSIAHHRLVDFYRLARPSISWESMPELTSQEPNPEAAIISAETIAQVKRMLAALSQPEQELLALRFAAGLSSAKIGALIGKSEAATKKQLTRLLHRMQEQYRRQELENLIPDLLEPILPILVAALRHIYAAPLPTTRLRAIRQRLLDQLRPISS